MEIDYTKVAEKAVEELAKDTYTDAVQPAARNVGGAMGTLTGFFNHVVLHPLKKLNIEYEQKAIAWQREMEKKYNAIPEDNRVEPQLNIVGPTLESMKYNIMDDDLAEMFSNLLVSDMDKTTQALCTPSFVKVIEQITPNDARMFFTLYTAYNHNQDRGICKISFSPKSKPGFVLVEGITPEFFTNIDEPKLNVYEKSRSIRNLQRLGLIEVDFSRHYTDNEVYAKIYNSTDRIGIESAVSAQLNDELSSKIESKGVMMLSSFGMDFAKVCLRDQ